MCVPVWKPANLEQPDLENIHYFMPPRHATNYVQGVLLSTSQTRYSSLPLPYQIHWPRSFSYMWILGNSSIKEKQKLHLSRSKELGVPLSVQICVWVWQKKKHILNTGSEACGTWPEAGFFPPGWLRKQTYGSGPSFVARFVLYIYVVLSRMGRENNLICPYAALCHCWLEYLILNKAIARRACALS